jgi:hypothetical protein
METQTWIGHTDRVGQESRLSRWASRPMQATKESAPSKRPADKGWEEKIKNAETGGNYCGSNKINRWETGEKPVRNQCQRFQGDAASLRFLGYLLFKTRDSESETNPERTRINTETEAKQSRNNSETI